MDVRKLQLLSVARGFRVTWFEDQAATHDTVGKGNESA